MIRKIQDSIQEAIKEALKKLYQLQEMPEVDAGYPEPNMGDLSYTVAFPLAKILKKNPKMIAQEIANALPPITEVQKVEVGGNGYLNFRLDRVKLARRLFIERVEADPALPGKAIVEHTNINPNKAAHVGHLRNACLGDVLVRLLE